MSESEGPPDDWRAEARRIAREEVEAATTISDDQGREWSVGQLMAEFSLSRRQALMVVGLLAAGNGLGYALLEAGVGTARAGNNSTGTIGSGDQIDGEFEDIVAETIETDQGTFGSVVDKSSGNSYDVDGLAAAATLNAGTNLSVSFGTWTTADSNAPVHLVIVTRVDTDGTTSGQILVEVDDSGGTTADYSQIVGFVDSNLGSQGTSIEVGVIPLPAGAQFRIVNDVDPRGGNNIRLVRKYQLQ